MPRGRKKGSLNKNKNDILSINNSSISVLKENENKKQRKPRVINTENRYNKIKDRIGKLKGLLVIIDQKKYGFQLCLKYESGSKDKYKVIFNHTDLELIKSIGNRLSEELKFSYNSNPIEKIKKSKKSKQETYDIFKEFNGRFFIYLSFGSIFLENHNKFHWKRNYELLDGRKIYELKKSNAQIKCKEFLISYSEDIKQRILKEVIHLGDYEDKMAVKSIMGIK
jgi:hypothetical protein